MQPRSFVTIVFLGTFRMIPFCSQEVLLLLFCLWAHCILLANASQPTAHVKKSNNAEAIHGIDRAEAMVGHHPRSRSQRRKTMDFKSKASKGSRSGGASSLLGKAKFEEMDALKFSEGKRHSRRLPHQIPGMTKKSALATHTKYAKSMSSRRRRRTALTKRAMYQSAIVSELGSDSERNEQRALTSDVLGPEHKTQIDHVPFKRILPSLVSASAVGNVSSSNAFAPNSTQASLLSVPQAMLHSMLGSTSSNQTGIMLCFVFIVAIAAVGGAAICMAMIDADREHTPRPPGMRLEDSRGSQPYSSVGMKQRQSGLPAQLSPGLSQPPPTAASLGNFGPTLNRPAAAPTEESQTTGQDSLCPSLVVPSGTEFVFAVQEVITTERQELSFNIVDLKGTPLSKVILSESRQATQPKIMLQTMAGAPLASVDTHEWHHGTSEPMAICRSSGALFGRIQKEPSSGRYVIRHRAGRKLLTFHGDFHEKAVNVMSSITGQLVGASEKCVVDFNSMSHYQVRVAPSTDAGLVICGLLAIDKLEGSRSTPPSTRPTSGYLT